MSLAATPRHNESQGREWFLRFDWEKVKRKRGREYEQLLKLAREHEQVLERLLKVLERKREYERERRELTRWLGLEWERQEQEREREREREAKWLRCRLRKQLALLKDVITRDVLLMKNLHSLREYLRFNLRERSHS